MSSNTSPPLSVSKDNFQLDPEELDKRHTTRLEHSLPVLQETYSDRIISPPLAKALLSKMTVTHQGEYEFTVEDQNGEYTTNASKTDCSCHSSLPDRNDRCEHLHHLHELDCRGLLPGPSLQTPSQTSTTENTSDGENQDNEMQCPSCHRSIGAIEDKQSLISFMTCNVCALENEEIYYIDQVPHEEKQLVYFKELLCASVDSYYHDNTTMSVYDFFNDHPDVQATDNVVLVHQRTLQEECSGLIFEKSVTAVPGSILTRATETLTEMQKTKNAEENDQKTETQTDSSENNLPTTATSPSP